jgi:hypothetical protein
MNQNATIFLQLGITLYWLKINFRIIYFDSFWKQLDLAGLFSAHSCNASFYWHEDEVSLHYSFNFRSMFCSNFVHIIISLSLFTWISCMLRCRIPNYYVISMLKLTWKSKVSVLLFDSHNNTTIFQTSDETGRQQCIAQCLDLIEPFNSSNANQVQCHYNEITGKCVYFYNTDCFDSIGYVEIIKKIVQISGV